MSTLDDMNSISKPPELSRSVVLMKAEDLSDEKVPPRPWESVQRPVDFILMTVKECEFLACLSLLNDGLYKSYHKTLGQVYFGTFGEGERGQKIAAIICNKGSSGPQGSAILVPKAVKKLRPKAVLNVGYCGGLNREKVKLGDVVVSSKLITYGATRVREEGIKELGHVVPLSSQLANLATRIDHGWKAPLTDPEELKVKIHRDGVMLSVPEVVDSKERLQQLLERFPRAIAIEMEGEGLYAAAHDLQVEWIVIKGVSDFADGRKTSTKSWQQFASVMAASLTAHILQHYKASSYIDDRGNNKRDTKKKDDKERMDDGDGDNASEEISEGGEQLPRKQHQIEEEAKKTRVYEGTVTSEGTHWDLKLGAVHLTFPPAAVTEPTLIVVHKWESSVCSPQLQEHEAIVSNVIEISTTTNEALQFKVGIKLVFSHCAPDLQGYELVIKRLINKETNDWKEVEGTVDARQLSDIEDEYPKEVPDFSFPVVQADITECSIYTVICRLKPSPTYTISSSGGCFNHPDYPGVAVRVPKKAVSVKSKISMELKVQEVPNDEFEGRNVYVGPILRISRTQGIEFLKPVTIQLPVAPRVEGGAIPDPLICRVRVLFLRSGGENKEWVDITDNLEIPARFDGTSVTFQVKHFCGYSVNVLWPNHEHSRDWNSSEIACFLSNIHWTQPRLAYFFAYFRLSESSRRQNILYLICCPAHLRDRVNHELKREGIRSDEASSRKRMIPGRDKAFVSVSGGISPVNEEDMADICLMLEAEEQSKDTLLIRLNSDQEEYGFVEFRSTRESVEENKLAKLPLTLPTLNVTHQPQDETIPGLRDSNEVSWDALQWLSWKIGKWEPLALRLDFENGEVYGFKTDNHGDNSAQARSMLFRWKEKKGQNATLQALCGTLRKENVGRTDLAEQMERGYWK